MISDSLTLIQNQHGRLYSILRIKPFPPLVLCLDVAGRLACPYDPYSFDGGSLCS